MGGEMRRKRVDCGRGGTRCRGRPCLAALPVSLVAQIPRMAYTCSNKHGQSSHPVAPDAVRSQIEKEASAVASGGDNVARASI
jgi:hypothetical protein